MGEYNSKRGVSDNLLHIRHTSKKIICILVVFFLIATVFSSIIPAQDTHTLIRNIIGKNTADQSDDSSKGTVDNEPVQKAKLKDLFKELSMLKGERTPIFSVVTKYNGTETTTRLRRFLPTGIDVNGDSKKDIRVWVFRFPGIEFNPPAACLKTTLLVRRLNDNIKNGPFEIYLQYTSKIISKLLGGKLDRIRIGYQTPIGAEVPDFCKLTNTYIPHLIYPRLKPVHKLLIDPGSIAGKTNLNLLFSIADMNGNNVLSQHIFNINYNPAVKTQVSIGRLKKDLGFTLELNSSSESKATIFYTKEEGGSSVDVGLAIDKLSNFKFQLDLVKSSKGGSTIEYKRLSSNTVNVTLFKRNSDNFYFYVNALPKHIVTTFVPESIGWMDINTFGEYVNEIGFCDDLIDPSWKLYFADLPTQAKLNWTLAKKKSLEAGNLKVSGDTNCSVHLNASVSNILNTNSNAEVRLDILVQNNIDMSASWDFKQRYLRLDQSKTDLNLSLSIHGENGNTFDGSCALKNLSSEPFTIFYDELSDEKANLSFIGKSFDVYNLDARTYLKEFGNFTVKMGHLVKNKNGNLTISLYATKNGSYINCNCTFVVTGGIEIYDLFLEYNGVWHNRSYVIVDDNDTLYFQFGGTFDVAFNIADDLSSGYIAIRGSIYIDVDFQFISNATSGMIKGKIHFNSNGESFNISWVTVSGARQFTIDGSALLSLSDFRLKFGDIIDISIPMLSGNLKLENVSKVAGAFELEFQGSGSLYLITSFKSSNKSNESDVQLNVSIDAEIETGETPGVIAILWDDYNVTSFETDLRDGGNLIINDLDITKTVDGNESLKVENLTAQLSGYLHVDINRANNTRNTFVATMEDANVSLHMDFFNASSYNLNNSIQGLNLGSINISIVSVGRTVFSLLNFTNESFIEPHYLDELNWYNLTMSIDANDSFFALDEFYIEHFANYSTISLKNLSVIDGYSKIKFATAVNLSIMVARFASLYFNNSQDANILLDAFSFDLVLSDIPPVPTILYSGKLGGGLLDMKSRFFDIILVEILNGSAIDHLGLEASPFAIMGIPDFRFNVYLDEPVDYLFFEVNDTIYGGECILIDTHNTSTRLNLSFLVSKNHIFGSDISNDAGFRIDNVKVKADNFYIIAPFLFYDPANASIYDFNISGYLHLEGGGNIWILVDGVWYPMYQYNGSITITPGHLKIIIDGKMSVNRNMPLQDGSIITIKGNFTAYNCTFDIWWNRTEKWVKIGFDGSLTAEDFLFKVEQNYNKNNQILMTSTSPQVSSLSWSTFHAYGPSYFFVDLGIEPGFSLYGSVNQVYATNLDLNNGNKNIEINSMNLSGEFNFSTLPERTDLTNYLGLNVSLNGAFEIDGVTSNDPNISRFDNVYFDGTGDLRFETWEDAESNITIYSESQNGFVGQLISIKLDAGRVFEVAHLTNGNANVGPGYVSLSWNIDGDANGMVFLDSSTITLDNARVSYWKPRHSGWGIRLGVTESFYAEEWHLQWFQIHKTGHIYIGKVDIDITDGDQWYNLWPPFHPGEMNGKSKSLPYYNGLNENLDEKQII